MIVKVGGNPTKVLIDSGAAFSCCSLNFAKKNDFAIFPLRVGDLKTLSTASGSQLNLKGKTIITMTLQGLQQDIECYVLEKLSQSFILGNDFLLKTKAKLDFGSREIWFYDDKVCLRLFDDTPTIPLIATLRATVLPPRSETLVPARMSRHINEEVALIEPLPMQEDQRYVVARTLVKPFRNRTFCRIANPTNHKIYLKRNWKLASLDTDLTDNISVIENNEDQSFDNYNDQQRTNRTTRSHYNNNQHNQRQYNQQHNYTRQRQTNETHNEVSENPTRKYTFEELGIELDRPNLSPEDRQKFVDLINEFGDCFAKTLNDLGGTKLVMHKIDTGDAPPVSRKPYKCSPEAQREITRQVNQMLEADIIEPSVSPWKSAVILVKKPPNPDGSPNYRFCIDYRALNKVTKMASCSMPVIDDVITAVTDAKAKVYSLIDLRSGYNQQFLDSQESRDRSAFVCQGQQFAFKRTSFGLATAPSSFQLLMNKMLQGLTLKICVCYLDDILCFSPDINQHIKDLTQIFTRFRQHGIKAHSSKTHLGLSRLKFLGYILSEKGLEIDPERIERLKAWPRPTSVKEVRKLIGFATFCRKHVPAFSRICGPLYNLTKVDTPWHWGEKEEKAFIELRDRISSPPILALPQCDKSFKIYTDASGTAVAWILAQVQDDNKEHVIAVGSKTLRGAQLKYPISELECLALVEALRANRHLLSNDVIHDCYSDHICLTYLNNLRFSSNPRLYRMSLFCDGFRIKIHYKKGSENLASDALTRIPITETPKDPTLIDQEDEIAEETVVFNINEGPSEVVKEDEVGDRSVTEAANTYTEYHFFYDDSHTENTTTNSEQDTHNKTEIDEDITPSILVINSTELNTEFQTSNTESDDISTTPNSDIYYQAQEEVTDTINVNTNTDETSVNVIQDNIPTANDLIQPDAKLFEYQYQPVDMAKLQRQCPELGPMIEYLQTGKLTDDTNVNKQIIASSEYFFIKDDNVLYHIEPSKRKNYDRISMFVEQLAIPQSLRAEITRGCHNQYCHHGADRTYAVLKARFFFNQAYKYVRGYVQNCEICQKAKREIHYKKHMLHPIPVNDLFTRFHIDILTLDCPDSQNRTHVLTVLEALSRYPEVFLLKTMSATEIAEILFREVFTRYGAPCSILSDAGSNLIGKVMTKLAEMFQVKRLVASSHHQQTNGRLERFHSTLLNALRCAKLQFPDRPWDDLLPPILAALRGVVSDNSGFSAFEIMFGKPMRLPLENTLPKPETTNTTPAVAAYVANMVPRLLLLRQIARENTKDNQQTFTDQFNKKAMIRNFSVGSKVLLSTPCQEVGQRKIGSRKTGPWLIVARLPDLTNNYVLRCCKTFKAHKNPVHPNRLSYFYSDENNLYQAGVDQDTDYDPPTNDMLQADIPLQSTSDCIQQQQPVVQVTTNATTLTGGDIQSPTLTNKNSAGQFAGGGDHQSQPQSAIPTQPPNSLTHGVIPSAQLAAPKRRWYLAEKLTKMKRVGTQRHFLVKWADPDAKPSWESEKDVSEALLNEFFIRYTLTGTRRKRRKS